MATKLIAILITLIGLSAVPTTDAHGKTETLHFATLHLEPYGFLGGEGAPRGIFQKIHATIARRAGFEFSDTVMPIKRALKAILRGTSDCGVFIRTRRNEEIYDHVAKVRDRFDSVIVTRSEFHITRVDGLNGHVLALPRGSYAGYSITESSKISRYLTNGYAQSARLLKAGRVDAIAGSAVSIFFNLHRRYVSEGCRDHIDL